MAYSMWTPRSPQFDPPDEPPEVGEVDEEEVVIDGARFWMPGWTARYYHCVGFNSLTGVTTDYGWKWAVEPPPELDGLDLVDVKAWSHIRQLVRFINAVTNKAENVEMER